LALGRKFYDIHIDCGLLQILEKGVPGFRWSFRAFSQIV